jgi:hypothetical protein
MQVSQYERPWHRSRKSLIFSGTDLKLIVSSVVGRYLPLRKHFDGALFPQSMSGVFRGGRGTLTAEIQQREKTEQISDLGSRSKTRMLPPRAFQKVKIYFAAVHESGSGPKRTRPSSAVVSAFGVKADTPVAASRVCSWPTADIAHSAVTHLIGAIYRPSNERARRGHQALDHSG